MRAFRLAVLLTTVLLATPSALAQEAERVGLDLLTVTGTIVYGLIGIGLCVLGFFAFDKIAGLSLKHELVEDQNVAIGIMLAGVFIGISIMVAAVMLS
ncbi:MAG: DUF350 domain-containing protein [Bacteroidota bacterium]